MERATKFNETYSFTEGEISRFSKAFKTHLETCGDDGNSGRYKIPKHWIKFTIFAPPRSGVLCKGVECSCGWSYYCSPPEKKADKVCLWCGGKLKNDNESFCSFYCADMWGGEGD